MVTYLYDLPIEDTFPQLTVLFGHVILILRLGTNLQNKHIDWVEFYVPY